MTQRNIFLDIQKRKLQNVRDNKLHSEVSKASFNSFFTDNHATKTLDLKKLFFGVLSTVHL